MIGLITGIATLAGKLFSNWQKKKEIESKGKIALAKADLNLKQKIAAGEIEYNVEAQKGMASSWKDEYLVVIWTLILICSFLPWTQLYVQKGFIFLEAHTPWWYSYCLVGMVVASFGLKGWNFYKLNGGKNGDT